MEPVPYEIRVDDVDEVLNAYEPTGGGRFSNDERREIRAHVMSHVTELDEVVRATPETEDVDDAGQGALPGRAGPTGERPGDQSSARRDMALGAIEDLLIRDGFLELFADESRTFPAGGPRDTERDD
ncbi:MAG: hypothetical protein ACRELX_09965 [Longimicrobiales bacterium]